MDIAIAGAVEEFQVQRDINSANRDVEHLGFLAHELRNTLTSVTISIQMIEKGKVGFGGSTGKALKNGLKRLGVLIDRSLTEVRLKVDPKANVEIINLLQLVENIILTAEVEAQSKDQKLKVQIDPILELEVDQQLFYSAVSNLIQNALKYTPIEGKIQVRGHLEGENIIVEVEDECGGLLSQDGKNLFKPFVQKHENRQGLGLGLSIAQKGMELNHRKIEARNISGKGCVFKITLPKNANSEKWKGESQLEDSRPH